MNGKSILIVDDEAPIREMIVVALEMAGYDCLEAENTQQAHALIIDRKPDLILLDWMLPGTSGLELARRWRKEAMTRDVPIIMLTARDALPEGTTLGTLSRLREVLDGVKVIPTWRPEQPAQAGSL